MDIRIHIITCRLEEKYKCEIYFHENRRLECDHLVKRQFHSGNLLSLGFQYDSESVRRVKIRRHSVP